MPKARLILDELKACGVEFVAWLPDSESRHLFDEMLREPELKVVEVCRENEAIAVCCGLYFGGRVPVAMIQNTGSLNAGDALRGQAKDMHLPLLVLIGYRSYEQMQQIRRGEPSGGGRIDSIAPLTEPYLQAMGIPYYLLQSDEDAPLVRKAFEQAQDEQRPVAVLITREWE